MSNQSEREMLCWDASSVMWTCLRAGTDPDGILVDFEGKQHLINTAQWGYDAAMNHMVAQMEKFGKTPRDCVLVFEGRDSKKRRAVIDPSYKAGRSKPPEAYVEFNKLKQMLQDTWLKVGAIAVTQDFVEGDDTLAFIAKNAEGDVVISTNDNDLAVLNGINEYGANIRVVVNGIVAQNKYGGFDFKLIALYKCLVGDSSDNIKGVSGFGPKAFETLNVTYKDDGCFELLNFIRNNDRASVEKFAVQNNCKLLHKISEPGNWQDAVRCLKLVTLHPEWINTVQSQLQWTGGMVLNTDDYRLRKYRGQVTLVTADNYAAVMDHLKKHLAYTIEPAFDIETSTPEESDAWLAGQKNSAGVDQMGSYLCGFSITYGRNQQYTVYVSVKHKDTNNVSMKQAREMIECMFDHDIVIQNTAFELAVLYNDFAADEDGTLWRDAWKKWGNAGLIPKVLDTKLEASYVDENLELGLKFRSKHHLKYEQESYQKTMTILHDMDGTYVQAEANAKKETVIAGTPWGGGTVLAAAEGWVRVEYKMHEVPASHVLAYGADDTITTSALHNLYRLIMELEHTYSVYKEVEIDAAYLHAKRYVDGMKVSLATLSQLQTEDEAEEAKAWGTLREYLISKGWDGTIPPTFTSDLTCKQIKEAYQIVAGVKEEEPDDEDGEVEVAEVKDAILSSRIRTPAKMLPLLESVGQDLLAGLVEKALKGDPSALQAYVLRHFKGDPNWKLSNKNMCNLLYTVMGVPIRVRNKPTEKMKQAGIREGNPKGDDLAIQYAIDDLQTDEEKEVLRAVQIMQMVKTRKGLFYAPYPTFVHWKTGKIHYSHNQCSTVTRRASASKPNLQQLSAKEKLKGFSPKIRNVIVPHRKGAVIVSFDFAAQELRLIAEQSQDANMLACYVGDNKKDMHSLTGCAIAQRADREHDWSYEVFVAAVKDENHPQHEDAVKYRGNGKTVNFATAYQAMADKIGLTMHVSSEEAQSFMDAREEVFYREADWKEEVIAETQATGLSFTLMGARRHLAAALNSSDRYEASKADRQGLNFRVQSSAAEQTKLAEGRFWHSGIQDRYDAQFVASVHDEVVFSVMLDEKFPEFLKEAHAMMTAPYATMSVPVESSCGFGYNFGELAEIGELLSDEIIAGGISKLKEKYGSTC